MKIHRCVLLLLMVAAVSDVLCAQGLNFSGTLDSRVLASVGKTASDFSMGFETWANLRFQTQLRDYATIYGAVNLIAASGSIAAAQSLPPTAFVAGENFAAALELERLYFRIKGEKAQLDTGLLRIPLGYSLVWGPTDFLCPPNPFLPDARPRGLLGTSFSAYPTDALKIFAFASAPKDPLNVQGDGYITGIGVEGHGEAASLQGFYAYETPLGDYRYGRHRGGFSLKADIEVGLTLGALYTYDPETNTSIEGLSGALGLDYSFFKGDLTLLTEYLYAGNRSSAAENLELSHNHYLDLTALYRLNDYTRLNFSCIADMEDVFFLPILGAEWEAFQGMTLSLSTQVPLYRDLFSSALITIKARLRF
ncbi:hypothetical protein AGMMS50293_11300 [Spirochaetia bacterium]|nr:hypothetical protein AGMMS50293_11300 [Spirochaetia bacterium]